ncbi:monomeric sarcosine oxidase-like [Amphiura filiformis]|uniref:monomeric sarcosine oxidase-like n=1 Tax=Amphiura filiformis TaxID=82378 RepID=UPI003B228E4C
MGSDHIHDCQTSLKLLEAEHHLLSHKQLMERYPFMTFEDGHEGVVELSTCGLVNPRKLVKAQRTAAHLQGCDIMTTIVDQIYENCDEPLGSKILSVVTANGQIVRSRKVLLCTGAFTVTKPLLPPHLLPDIRLAPSQALKLEVSADDLENLRGIPMMEFWRSKDDRENGYLCPPVTYPNGKTYLKIGHERLGYFERYTDVAEWYRGDGDQEVTEKLKKSIHAFLPGFEPLSFDVHPCVLTATKNNLPYIDMITPQIGIAVGGNGEGARWSYEVGKIAANMITKGQWDYDLPKDNFKVQFQDQIVASKL